MFSDYDLANVTSVLEYVNDNTKFPTDLPRDVRLKLIALGLVSNFEGHVMLTDKGEELVSEYLDSDPFGFTQFNSDYSSFNTEDNDEFFGEEYE